MKLERPDPPAAHCAEPLPAAAAPVAPAVAGDQGGAGKPRVLERARQDMEAQTEEVLDTSQVRPKQQV